MNSKEKDTEQASEQEEPRFTLNDPVKGRLNEGGTLAPTEEEK